MLPHSADGWLTGYRSNKTLSPDCICGARARADWGSYSSARNWSGVRPAALTI